MWKVTWGVHEKAIPINRNASTVASSSHRDRVRTSSPAAPMARSVCPRPRALPSGSARSTARAQAGPSPRNCRLTTRSYSRRRRRQPLCPQDGDDRSEGRHPLSALPADSHRVWLGRHRHHRRRYVLD